MTKQTKKAEESIIYPNFPHAERKVFSRNYLEQAIIELRFPTLLRLKEKEPTDIQQKIRAQFPHYSSNRRMQMTPLGSTEPEPIYQFVERSGDPFIELSASTLVLIAKNYKSFEEFLEKTEFLIKNCLPLIDTNFFTRIGLRYINSIGKIPNTCDDLSSWVNPSLLSAISSGEVGTISNMKNEISGSLENGGYYNFKYGLSPPRLNRTFVLDYDYGKDDVDVSNALETLRSFHNIHFDFFWWSLGDAAKEALENGNADRT